MSILSKDIHNWSHQGPNAEVCLWWVQGVEKSWGEVAVHINFVSLMF